MPKSEIPIDNIQIRRVVAWDDCLQCEGIQEQVWAMGNVRDLVPAHLLITVVKNGGLLLGAYDGSRMIGFVFGFLGSGGGSLPASLKHCSHMLGVLPDYRAAGIGWRLKLHQRMLLIEQGVGLATWTYDPLQAVNVRLNIARLGGIARHYIREAYGEMTDALNAGYSPDRLEVEWFLTSQRVEKVINNGGVVTSDGEVEEMIPIDYGKDGLPRMGSVLGPTNKRISLEIPTDIGEIKRRDLPLARVWRASSRLAFENAFDKGYVVTNVLRQIDDSGRMRVRYLMEYKPDWLR